MKDKKPTQSKSYLTEDDLMPDKERNDLQEIILRLKLVLQYTDGTTMGAVIATDQIKSLIKKLQALLPDKPITDKKYT